MGNAHPTNAHPTEVKIMRDSFWGLIWQSFKEINGILLGFLGVIVSLITWSFLPKTKISLNLVFIVFIFLVIIIIIITLLEPVYKAFKQNKKLETQLKKLINPAILIVQREPLTDLIVCLLEKSDLFTIETQLSFYYTDEDGFERLIGIGFVKNIQSDGKIQALIHQRITSYQNVVDKLERKTYSRTLGQDGLSG